MKDRTHQSLLLLAMFAILAASIFTAWVSQGQRRALDVLHARVSALEAAPPARALILSADTGLPVDAPWVEQRAAGRTDDG